MISYQGKKVSAKVKAKHIVSDEVIKIFDRLKLDPKSIDVDWDLLTVKEQGLVEDQVSLFEDRIHRLLGINFESITSSTNYKKIIK
tara:strand:+ start:577 stop:834 length:258 start_codon:yes stop_codon:yes gene_type:complete